MMSSLSNHLTYKEMRPRKVKDFPEVTRQYGRAVLAEIKPPLMFWYLTARPELCGQDGGPVVGGCELLCQLCVRRSLWNRTNCLGETWQVHRVWMVVWLQNPWHVLTGDGLAIFLGFQRERGHIGCYLLQFFLGAHSPYTRWYYFLEKQWTELFVEMNLSEYQAWTLFCFWLYYSFAVWSWAGHFPSVDFSSLTRKMNSCFSISSLRWLGISPGCFPWIIAYWESYSVSFFPVRKPAALQRPQCGICLSVCIRHGDHPAVLPD